MNTAAWKPISAAFLMLLAMNASLLIPLGGEALVLLLTLIGAIGMGVQRSVSKQRWDWWREDTVMALAFASIMLLQLISVLWSQWPKQSAASAFKHLHFLVWPLLVWVLAQGRESLRWMERGVLLALFGAFFWILLPTQWGWTGGHFEAAAQNPSVFGKIVAVLGLWALVLASGMQRRASKPKADQRPPVWRYAYALAWALSLPLLLAADRRIELVLYVVLSLGFIMLRLFRRGQLRLALFLTFAAGGLMAAALIYQGERFARSTFQPNNPAPTTTTPRSASVWRCIT
jgi:hypothetical protein